MKIFFFFFLFLLIFFFVKQHKSLLILLLFICLISDDDLNSKIFSIININIIESLFELRTHLTKEKFVWNKQIYEKVSSLKKRNQNVSLLIQIKFLKSLK